MNTPTPPKEVPAVKDTFEYLMPPSLRDQYYAALSQRKHSPEPLSQEQVELIEWVDKMKELTVIIANALPAATRSQIPWPRS